MSRTSHQKRKLKQRGRVSFVASVALLLMASFAMAMGLLASPAQAADTVPVPPVPNGMTYDYPCGSDGSGVWTGIPADADFDAYDYKFDNSSPQHLIVVYTDNPIDGRTFPNGTDTYDYGLPADAGMTCQPQDQSVTPTEPTVTTAASCDNNGVMTVTPDSQSGALVWDPSGATDIQPGDSQQFTATAADGYAIPDGAQKSWTKSNNFDTSGCTTTPPADDLVHVKPASLSDHRNDCGESFATSGQLNVTDPDGVVFEWVKLSDGTVLHAGDVTIRTQGNVMQITVPLSEGQYIVDAAIDPPDGWSGQFVLSHYTCSETPPPPTSQPGTATATSGACSKLGETTGTATVKVTNTADDTEESVPYDVTLNGVTKQLTLADGASDSVVFNGLAPGSYDWSVTGPDGTDVKGKVTVAQCETPPPPPPFHCSDGSTPGDVNHDGTVDGKDCVTLGPTPHFHCPNGSTPGDVNHDGTVDAKDCQSIVGPTSKPHHPKPKPNALPHAGWTQAAAAAQQTDSSAAMWFLVAAMLGSLSIGSATVGVVRRRQGGAR